MGWRHQLKRALMGVGVYGTTRRCYLRTIPSPSRRRLRREMEFYGQFIKPDDLCFDVGSNIGAKAEVFLELGARVVAFEPQPDCYREMVARCGRPGRLTALNVAVGSEPGEATLYVDRTRAGSSLRAGWGGSIEAEIRVPMETLDRAIARYGPPNFCKIDVEGFELEVLRGLSRPIPYLTLEYHLDDEDVRKTRDCLKMLAKLASLSLNLSFGEEPGLCWSDWVDLDEFHRYFPERAPRSRTCGYGDLFVKMS
jgi:FkbM family methyltransferase